MTNLSRPLLVLLVGAVAMFGAWTFALKPKSSSSATAQATSTSAAAGHAVSAIKQGTTTPLAAKPAIHHAPAVRQRLDIVARALGGRKVVALLFYNPLAADDRAVKQELAAVPVHGGKVVKLAVPLSELTRYPIVSYRVAVTASPTLVLIDRHQQAREIVGFADRFEIAGRVADALVAN